MIELASPFRQATPDDAASLVQLIDMAGEGLPTYLWARMATQGETVREVGLRRARREDGSFSYRNAIVLEQGGNVAACLIGYRLAVTAEPIGEDFPPMFRPLQELENLVPGTWYVNALATVPEYRGRGFGRDLLNLADRLAAKTSALGLSIIVTDANEGARRLYERCGYRQTAERSMVKEDWENPGSNWLLLTKSADG